MIVVTGSMRSGTSMWMQLLVEGGLDWLGEQFPATWEEDLGEANREGFYESHFRMGIRASDPLAKTLSPSATRKHALKVFVQGLIRTDKVYLDRVIGTIRPFRVVEASRQKMMASEDEAARLRNPSHVPPVRMEGHLHWWCDNYMLLCDAMRRRYPFRFVAYDRLLSEPEALLPDIFRWIGRGDAERALAQVKPEHRRSAPSETSLEPELAAVFDELYEAIAAERELSRAFLTRLQHANQALLPRIQAARARIQADQRERAARQASPTPFT